MPLWHRVQHGVARAVPTRGRGGPYLRYLLDGGRRNEIVQCFVQVGVYFLRCTTLKRSQAIQVLFHGFQKRRLDDAAMLFIQVRTVDKTLQRRKKSLFVIRSLPNGLGHTNSPERNGAMRATMASVPISTLQASELWIGCLPGRRMRLL